jgi:hypothetical protein
MASGIQAKTPSRTTLLEAVNVCLGVIGEAPVESLDEPEIIDAKLALETLLEVHKDGQTKGWSFNRDESRAFLVDATGGITLPDNVIRWTPDIYQWGHRFQLRGSRVWDKETGSYTLPAGINQVVADTTSLLAWDDVPEAYNRWATVRGARVYAGRALGSADAIRFSGLDEQAALVELETLEAQNDRPNILTGGYGLAPFPTYSPGLGIARRRMGPNGAVWR